MTLIEFLLARIAEDEKVARSVDLTPDTRGIYQRRTETGLYETYTPSAAEFYVMRVRTASEDGHPANVQDRPATDLFRTHDPVRVLAECAAKRKIIERVAMLDEQGQDNPVFGYHATGVMIAVRILASVYADHQDYQAEWAA